MRWFYLKSVHNGSKLPIDLLVYVHTKPKLGPIYRDEFELEFSGSSKPEVPSQAELGHFNFQAETELKFFKH